MTITIKAEKREAFGKNASRQLRRRGLVPAILYAESVSSVPLALDKKDIIRIMKTETRENTLFQVGFNAELRDVMIKELQVDPATDQLLHADLIQIAMDKLIRVTVPIVPKGEAFGVKTEGGFVDFVTREVEIECLPKDIPTASRSISAASTSTSPSRSRALRPPRAFGSSANPAPF